MQDNLEMLATAADAGCGAGRGGMFSLEEPEGVRFVILSRVFTEGEMVRLAEAGLI